MACHCCNIVWYFQASPPMQTVSASEPGVGGGGGVGGEVVGGGSGEGVNEADGLDEDWRRKYVRIESVEQRKLYKKEFAANYQEYKTLHTYIQQVWSSSTNLFCLCFYFPSWKGVK